MTPTARRPGRRRGLGLLLVLAVLLSACSSEPVDPSERLAEAVDRTFGGTFQYRLSAVSDREALSGLGAEAGRVAQFLNTFNVAGTIAEDATSLQLRAVTTTPIFEFRRFDDDDVFVRLGLADLLGGGFDADLAERVLPAMDQLGIPTSVRDATSSLFAGDWISVEGEIGGQLGDVLQDEVIEDPSADTDQLQEDLGGNLPGFVQRFVTVTSEEEGEGGERTYAIELQLRALLRTVGEVNAEVSVGGLLDLAALEEQLESLPEEVVGEAVVEDGYVTEVRFDVAEAARAGGQEIDGSIVVRLQLSGHGAPEPVERPDSSVVVPSEDLAAALEIMIDNPLPQPDQPNEP